MEGKFTLFNKTNLKKMKIGDSIPDADFTTIRGGFIYQFKWKETYKKPNIRLLRGPKP